MHSSNNSILDSVFRLSTPYLVVSNTFPKTLLVRMNGVARTIFPTLFEDVELLNKLDLDTQAKEKLTSYLSVANQMKCCFISNVSFKDLKGKYGLDFSPIITESVVEGFLVHVVTTDSNQIFGETSVQLEDSELGVNDNNFRTIIKQAPVGICIIKRSDLKILDWNYQFQETIGRNIGDVVGKTIWELVPEVADVYKPLMDRVIETGVGYVAKEHELMFYKHNVLTSVIIDFVFEPIKDVNQHVVSVMIVSIDVTDKVVARRKIEDVEERNRLAVEAAEIGTFDYKYKENVMVASDRLKQIFGIKTEISRQDILNLIHPNDLHLSDEAHERALKDGRLLYEARVLNTDGNYRWVRIQANLYLDENREAFRLLGTILDITEFKKLQQQKEDFVSIASHELKTPITSLKASLQLLERFKDDFSSPIIKKLIEQSTKSMGKISNLVEDLLNVSRMSVGHVPLNKTHFDIQQLLEDISASMSLSNSISIVLSGEKELMVFADEHRIDQVVTNFLTNAIKHAKTSTEINIVSERIDQHRLQVTVSDNGTGIEAQKLPFLFDRYYQGDQSSSSFSGLGLGLYIAAEIIQRHDGEIGVESELGVGSSFWFTLPLESQ